jgi:hypothetical protein
MGSLFANFYGKKLEFSASQCRNCSQPDEGRQEKAGRLNRNFRQHVHSLNFGRYAELFPFVLHPQYTGVTTHPTLFAGGEFGRKNHDEFEVGALDEARLCKEKDAVGADIASFSAEFLVSITAFYAHRHAGDNSLARTTIKISTH